MLLIIISILITFNLNMYAYAIVKACNGDTSMMFSYMPGEILTLGVALIIYRLEVETRKK